MLMLFLRRFHDAADASVIALPYAIFAAYTRRAMPRRCHIRILMIRHDAAADVMSAMLPLACAP